MKDKLINMSPSECFALYEKILANSNKKWESSQTLAVTGDFGGAINTQIVSIEEAIKSLILFMDSEGFEFRKIQGIESILRRSHVLRHYVSFLMLLFNIFLNEIKNLILQIRENPQIIRKFDFKSETTERRLAFFVLRRFVHIRSEFYWFARLESLRQKSSHVDFEPIVTTPQELTEADYKALTNRLKVVRDTIFDFVNTISDQNPIVSKEIINLKRKFIAENWYAQIENTLSQTKGGKKNPFELTRKSLEDLMN